MNTVVVYGGRFQPMHKGHKSSYDFLVKKFGANNVYVASADKATGPKDPFTFDEKRKIALMLGIPADKFVKVTSVYNMDLIQKAIPFDKDNTVLIVALSQKDGERLISNVQADGFSYKKNGEKAAIQWLRDNPQPASSGEFYVVATPTLEFPVAGKQVTGATEIRNLYATSDDKTRVQILKDLYPKPSKQLKQVFDKALTPGINESLLREFIEAISKF
jgi:hypothetical protein